MTDQSNSRVDTVDRRSLLAGGLAAAGVAAALTASGTARAESGHEHHAGHGGPAPHQAVIDAALACVNRGDVCADHCITLYRG
jgi:hypothetical protein